MEILAGVIGAILGGAVAMLVQRIEAGRQGRTRLTLEIYREWQSSTMLEARVRANQAFTANSSTEMPRSFVALHDHYRDSGVDDRWTAITMVIHFLEECGALVDAKAIDPKLFNALLGRYVRYWVDRYVGPWMAYSMERDDPAELAWYLPVERLRAATT